jgi:hypothetical protein
MTGFSKSVAHVDISGMGFGNTFISRQKCTLEYARANMQERGVECELQYAYLSDIAEATFTLKDNEGNAVGGVKFAERWQNFGDEKKPHIHAVYNYDLYVGTPTNGWLQVAFAQAQESRSVPSKIAAEITESLNGLARSHNLFTKVRALVFGAR